MRFAILPFSISPIFFSRPMAYAPLIVAALIASVGVIFIFIHAKDIVNPMFPEGHDPGLKSVAIAIGNPESISVCVVGGMSNTGQLELPFFNNQQQDAVDKVKAFVKKNYNIGETKIIK